MKEKNTFYNKKFGLIGEDSAAEFLQNNNFEIIERNYRFRRAGEIDIIARKENLIIFVEVKARNTSIYGGALYSLNSKKKKAIKYVAKQFIISRPCLNKNHITFRFDMISIEKNSIDWIQDILR